MGGVPPPHFPTASLPSMVERTEARNENRPRTPTGQPSKPSEVASEPFEGASAGEFGPVAPDATGDESSKDVARPVHAREAMHRLGYVDADAEAQLQATLQTVPAAVVAADLNAIADERGLPPTVDPERERYAEWLARRGFSAADAAELAPRLVSRDRGGDDRRACAECARFKRVNSLRAAPVWYCQHPQPLVKHGYPGPTILFRCEGFLGAG